MITKIQLSVIIALTMGFAALVLTIRGEQPNIVGLATVLGITTTFVYGSVLVFNHIAWEWWIFRPWLVNSPCLKGTWKVTLFSDYIDKETGEQVSPIDAYMIVRQTLTTLSMRLLTDKARSVTIAYAIQPVSDGVFDLSLVYRNSPKIELQGKESSIHHGSLLIEIHDIELKQMEGHYWTDRGTRGTIKLNWVTKKLFPSFEDAKKAAESK